MPVNSDVRAGVFGSRGCGVGLRQGNRNGQVVCVIASARARGGAGSVSISGNQVAGLTALQAALRSWCWPNHSFKRKPLRGPA